MALEEPPSGLDLRPHFSIDSSITFLNHGSFGATPIRIQHHQTELRTRMEAEPVRFFTRELPVLLDRVRNEFAEFLGASPSGLAFVTNTTEGVNAVLRSLELHPDEEILVTDLGYSSCTYAAHFVAERAGARVSTAPIALPLQDPSQVVEAIVEAVTARTRLAIIDHITSSTGLIFPIDQIVAALREKGVETLVDGAHAPGMIPLNLDALGAAYYVGNCHKWLSAPRGSAFLSVRQDLLPSVRPTTISLGALAPPGPERFRAEFDWTGTRDPSSWLAIGESLRFLGSLLPGRWEGIYARNRALAIYARELLSQVAQTAPLCPDSMIGSLATIELPRGDHPLPRSVKDVDPLQVELFEQAGIEVPIFALHDPPRRLLRISAALYNRPEDFQHLARHLARLLDHPLPEGLPPAPADEEHLLP